MKYKGKYFLNPDVKNYFSCFRLPGAENFRTIAICRVLTFPMITFLKKWISWKTQKWHFTFYILCGQNEPKSNKYDLFILDLSICIHFIKIGFVFRAIYFFVLYNIFNGLYIKAKPNITQKNKWHERQIQS